MSLNVGFMMFVVWLLMFMVILFGMVGCLCVIDMLFVVLIVVGVLSGVGVVVVFGMMGLKLNVFNYIDVLIGVFYVDGIWGGMVLVCIGSGGGVIICCVVLLK